MFLSVFDMFKIGIGPSSSHTVGPMVAARRFLDLAAKTALPRTGRLTVTLHGSLAFTGKGHGTDRAVVLGLAGETPQSMDPDRVEEVLRRMAELGHVAIAPDHTVSFNPARDVIFDFGPALKGHANGMVFRILDDGSNTLLAETFFSIGGGFVQTEAERATSLAEGKQAAPSVDVPYPFRTAAEMLEMGRRSGLTVAEMKRANERVTQGDEELDVNLDHIWSAMRDCMNRGLVMTGTLPGGLKVKRRAAEIHTKLRSEQGNNAIQPHQLMDWLSVYAMAVNEENAAGGRVVTAPTNGAAGVIPATIRYYLDHCLGADEKGIRVFLLAAAAIGGLIKHNASISGAEVGCQGEVGSASAMAAAGLCAALGGSNEQVENAAEIALEHHLGMTCDPVGGLVQVPCIERNAFGAVKAVTAASLALRGDGTHFVPLDTCVETMRQTGLDMSERYKETSTGGLAVNVVEC
jgi:L-serine dehydratase